MPIQLFLFSATCQFFYLHFSGNWHVAEEPTAAFGMSVKILKRLAVVINSAHSRPKNYSDMPIYAVGSLATCQLPLHCKL
jgi:hypothetical protein